MPLTEAEREITENGNGLFVSHDKWTAAIEIVDLLWLQRRRILVWVLIGLALSGVVAWRYPKYQATAQLMPPSGGAPAGLAALAFPMLSKAPGFAGLSGLAGADNFLGANTGAVFVKVLESRTVADKLVDRFDLRKRYDVTYWEDARKKLGKRTDVSEDKKSGVITIEVKDHDPKVAAAMAAAYIEELDHLMATVSTSAARRERIFIEQRLADEKTTLDDAEKKLSQFQTSSMAVDVPEQTRVMVEAAARLQGELIAKRAQLQGLEQIYAPESARIKSARSEIASLERELSHLNTAPPDQATSPNPYPSVKSLPVLGVQWSDLYRTAKIHETVYELLTQQYEVARIQEAKEIPTVKVLDAPVPPERRSPKPVLVLFLGFVASVLLACTGAILKNRWDAWDENDPRRVLLMHVYRPGLLQHQRSHHEQSTQ
jgi:uncharacterized protein involved in exopolysaccharide biosynthesis